MVDWHTTVYTNLDPALNLLSQYTSRWLDGGIYHLLAAFVSSWGGSYLGNLPPLLPSHIPSHYLSACQGVWFLVSIFSASIASHPIVLWTHQWERWKIPRSEVPRLSWALALGQVSGWGMFMYPQSNVLEYVFYSLKVSREVKDANGIVTRMHVHTPSSWNTWENESPEAYAVLNGRARASFPIPGHSYCHLKDVLLFPISSWFQGHWIGLLLVSSWSHSTLFRRQVSHLPGGTLMLHKSWGHLLEFIPKRLWYLNFIINLTGFKSPRRHTSGHICEVISKRD